MSDNLSLSNPPDTKISDDIYEVVIEPITDSVLFTTKKVSMILWCCKSAILFAAISQRTCSSRNHFSCKYNEAFLSFQSGATSSNCMYNLRNTPTLKELYQYITDMAPFYYDIGLELDIVNSKLKFIKNNPST